MNLNFFNQKIFKGKEELSLVTKKKIIKDSVDNLHNNLEDEKITECIEIETNIAIKNNKVENIESNNKEEKPNIDEKENGEKKDKEENKEKNENKENKDIENKGKKVKKSILKNKKH